MKVLFFNKIKAAVENTKMHVLKSKKTENPPTLALCHQAAPKIFPLHVKVALRTATFTGGED